MADYTARSSVILNGQQADDQLEKLTNRAKGLRDEMKKLRQANDLAGFKEKERELKEVNKEMRQMRKEVFSVEAVLKNLSGASFKEISTAARKANAEFKAMKQTDPGYNQKAAQVKLLNGKMRELSNLTRSQQSLWGRAANSFNKYFSIITAGAASFAGVFLGMRKAINASNDFEERLSNLSALTSLAGEDLQWLSQQAQDLAQSTLEGGIRITKSAQDIVDAYTKMGSARPELLKNKEDLVEVTKQALVLAEAAKMEMQPAIDAVAASMNQFNLPASESVKIINALAAGSLAGSAEVFDITESLANVGTVAADSNLSLEQTVGVLETLAERQLKGAEAGTQLRSSLLSMKAAGLGYQSGVFNMRDAVTELKNRIDAQNTAIEKDNVLIDVFGKRNITVGTILVNSVDRLDEFTRAVTDTNTATEQAITNTDNNNAKLAQAKNRINVVSIELGQKLAPAYASVISKSSAMLRFLTVFVDLLNKHGKTLLVAASGIAAYTIAINATNIATKVYNVITTAATAITKGFNTAVKSNPVGLLVSLLTAAATAFFLFRNKAKEATPAQKEFNDMVEQGNNLLLKTKTLEERASIIKNLSKEQLENFKSDLQNQLAAEEEYHATLLQKLKKRLSEDEELKKLAEARSQEGLSQIQKINLDAQINARKKALAQDLESENQNNQKRLVQLKKYLSNVDSELKTRSDGTSDAEKINKFLGLDPEEQQAAIKKYFSKLGKTAFEDFIAAIEKTQAQNNIDFSVGANLEKPEEEQKVDPESDYLLKKYQETIDFKLALNDAMYQQGLIGETQYQDQLTKLTQQAEDERFEIKQNNIRKYQDMAFMATNFVSALMDLELEKAGDNEEKKKEIKKKYADVNFAVTVAQIVADTAGAIMEGFRQLGPIGGAIAAGLLAATGLVQIGIANAQRKKVKAYATGKYPGATFVGRPQTGMYGDKPHLGIFNEVPGQPETIIDGITTRKLQLNYPGIMEAIWAVKDGRNPQQYATGKYSSSGLAPVSSPGSGEVSAGRRGMEGVSVIDKATVNRFTIAIEKLLEWDPRIGIDVFERQRQKYNDINKNSFM